MTFHWNYTLKRHSFMNQDQLLSPKFSTLSKLKVKCVFISLIHVVHFLQPNAISVSFPFSPSILTLEVGCTRDHRVHSSTLRLVVKRIMKMPWFVLKAYTSPEIYHLFCPPSPTQKKEKLFSKDSLAQVCRMALISGVLWCLQVSTLRVFYCVAR